MAYNAGGLTQGFAQGFGMAQQYQNNQQRQQDRQEDRALRREQIDFQRENQQEQREWRREDRQKEDDALYAKSMFSRLQSGQELKDSDYEFLERRPEFDPGFLASDEMTNAIERGKQVLDPNTPIDGNDPESLDALNTMFGPRINAGHGKNKRIAGMYPGKTEGTVVFDLEVEGEDGQKYNAPMTSKRGKAGDDDDVLEVPVENLVDHFQGYAQLNQAFRHQEMTDHVQRATQAVAQRRQQRQPISDKERQQALKFGQSMGLVSKPETTYQTINGPGGSILQQGSDGSLRSVLGRAPQPSASLQRTPTSIQEFNFLKQNGGLSDEEAIKLVYGRNDTGAVRDRDVFNAQLDQVDDTIKSLDKRLQDGFALTDADKKQIQQQRQQAVAERQQLIAGASGGGSRKGAISGVGQQKAGPAQSGAPDAAVNFLRQNDSPEMRQNFKQKYGYLPEGM